MFEGGGVHAQKDPAHRFRGFGGSAFYRVLADPWQHFVEVYEVVVQIPDKHERGTIYYGGAAIRIYSNASKLRQGVGNGVNQDQQAALDEGEPQQDFKNKKKTRLRWAQLMDKIWKALSRRL